MLSVLKRTVSMRGSFEHTKHMFKLMGEKKYFSYFTTKTYVVCAQKNRLNETVLLNTQNTCLNWWVRKYLEFHAQKVFTLGPKRGIISCFNRQLDENTLKLNSSC